MAVDHKYLWLCVALALWGLGQGAGPVVEALLADSTRTGACYSMIRFHHKAPLCIAHIHLVLRGLSTAHSGAFNCIKQVGK